MLHHERLDVYQCSIDFLAEAEQIAAGVPRGFADVKSQLRRAAVSIPLNIAEASGRSSRSERAQFYGVARGSAMECAAVIDVLHLLQVIDVDMKLRNKDLLERIVAMLTRMKLPLRKEDGGSERAS